MSLFDKRSWKYGLFHNWHTAFNYLKASRNYFIRGLVDLFKKWD